MTALAFIRDVFPYAAGAAAGAFAVTFGPAIACWRRGPVQVFHGRVFPHPLDDRWEVVPGRARIGELTVTRTWLMHQTWPMHQCCITTLAIGDVRVADDARAERYLCAIEAAHRDRTLQKALEAIP